MALTTAPRQATREDVWVPTACDMCYNRCSIRVRRVDGVAVKIEGLSESAQPNYGKTCAKGNSGLLSLYNPARITHPLVRTNPEKGLGVDPKWKQISWDEALELAVSSLRAARAKDPRSLVLSSFDTVVGELRSAFLTAFGSPNNQTGSSNFFCGRGHHPTSYTLTGSNDIHPDIGRADLVLMFGTSWGFVSQHNAMGITAEMAEARARGLKLVVIDPMCTYAASKADEWVPIRPGTDACMALSMMHVLVNELGVMDVEYLKQGTNAPYLVGPDGRHVRDAQSGKPLVWDEREGRAAPYDAVPPLDAALEGRYRVGKVEASTGFTLFREHLTAYPPERAEQITTVPAATIRRLAEAFGQAARVGATITLDGQELPFRPAAACWYRGVSGHKHALHFCMSVAQLNMVVGAVDVPGGMINGLAASPFYGPEVGPDGLIVPGGRGHWHPPLPRRQVREPETVDMVDLFPLAYFSGTMMYLHLAHPELRDRWGLAYRPEVFIHSRTNPMAMGGDPSVVAEALEHIGFQISFAMFQDETTQFADLVLPDQHSLERLGGIAYNTYTRSDYKSAARPDEEWAFNLQQPVVPAVGETRFWAAVLVDFAYRMGLVEEFNQAFNTVAGLQGDLRLASDRTYAWPDMLDRLLKQQWGRERGLDYFQQHGYHSTGVKRSVAQSYPRRFHNARVPLYLEFYLQAGEDVREYMEEHDIGFWDTSDYVPLMEWKPCPAYHAPPEYDLFVVNQKIPFLAFSYTQFNPWLTDLAGRNSKIYPVAINAETARRKGIADGDRVVLETPAGQTAQAVARVTECVHPECLAIAGVVGRQLSSLAPKQRQGVHFNSLVGYTFENYDFMSGAVDQCVKVKITRAK
ncbi:MAG: molybdopterin-dependent oxidoreductase [Chloroflexi bacterium]|nr:molybdopterin-dependent oxidoreductase [Chloroflexota bacterium]